LRRVDVGTRMGTYISSSCRYKSNLLTASQISSTVWSFFNL
jgi:hypothetical protein